ncbi:MAG: hypothetical protein ACPGWR_20405, partial [Ardenticatenaceae bacterium]
MRLRNLLLICFIFVFVIGCSSETPDITEAQIDDSGEASGAAQDVADEHDAEEGEHDAEEGEHDAEEGEHDAE